MPYAFAPCGIELILSGLTTTILLSVAHQIKCSAQLLGILI